MANYPKIEEPGKAQPNSTVEGPKAEEVPVGKHVRYLVGVDTNGVPIQQVEWLCEKENGSGTKEFFWAGAEVRPLAASKHAFTKVEVPRHAFPKGHALAKPEDTHVTGWIRSQSIVPIVERH